MAILTIKFLIVLIAMESSILIVVMGIMMEVIIIISKDTGILGIITTTKSDMDMAIRIVMDMIIMLISTISLITITSITLTKEDGIMAVADLGFLCTCIDA